MPSHCESLSLSFSLSLFLPPSLPPSLSSLPPFSVSRSKKQKTKNSKASYMQKLIGDLKGPRFLVTWVSSRQVDLSLLFLYNVVCTPLHNWISQGCLMCIRKYLFSIVKYLFSMSLTAVLDQSRVFTCYRVVPGHRNHFF